MNRVPLVMFVAYRWLIRRRVRLDGKGLAGSSSRKAIEAGVQEANLGSNALRPCIALWELTVAQARLNLRPGPLTLEARRGRGNMFRGLI